MAATDGVDRLDRTAPLNIELDAETGDIRIERTTPLGTYVTVVDR